MKTERDLINKNKVLKEKIKRLKLENIELQKIAYFDSLTGVFNRTWFYKNVNYNDKWYVSLVDLNNLKQTNDLEGHFEGDKLILKVINKLKKYGTIVRYGGDEFIVLTKDKVLFDELNNLCLDDFSCGGTDISEYNNIAEAINIADKRLYEKKRAFHKRNKSSNI